MESILYLEKVQFRETPVMSRSYCGRQQLLGEEMGVPGGHQVGHNPAVCPLANRPMVSWLHEDRHCQQVDGAEPCPLLSPGEASPEVMGAVLGPQ